MALSPINKLLLCLLVVAVFVGCDAVKQPSATISISDTDTATDEPAEKVDHNRSNSPKPTEKAEESPPGPDDPAVVVAGGERRSRAITYGPDELPGTYDAPEGGRRLPAVLLVHQLNADRSEWDRYGITPALHEAGAVTLAVDLRGHGSPPAGKTAWKKMPRSDWQKVPTDLAEAIAWLREQPEVDPNRVSLIGGSVGANAVLLAFAADDKVAAVVALSPGLPAFKGLQIGDVPKAAGDRPLWVVASKGDGKRAADAKALTKGVKNSRAVVLGGGLHGARQLHKEEKLRGEVVDRLTKR